MKVIDPTTRKAARINKVVPVVEAPAPKPRPAPQPVKMCLLRWASNRRNSELTDQMREDGSKYYSIVCHSLKVDPDMFNPEVFGDTRHEIAVQVRKYWSFALMVVCRYSQPEVAMITGRPSHSTINAHMDRVRASKIQSLKAISILRTCCPHCGGRIVSDEEIADGIES